MVFVLNIDNEVWESHGHVFPYVYSGVYYNMDLWMARILWKSLKRQCSLYTAGLKFSTWL